MSQVLDPSLGEQAQAALNQHAWGEAYDLLSKADQAGELAPEELELLAQASWWVGKLPAAIDARERAYAALGKAGDPLMAAATAVLIGRDNLLRNARSVAIGWLNRAERLLKDMDETPIHGWLAVVRSLLESQGGEFATAFAQAARAHELARRFGDRDLEGMALSSEGMALIYQGDVEKGLALVDEATVSAVAGELEPQVAGAVCCTNIGASAALGDWLRAAQWTEAQDRWCEREHINGFPGMCRLYRAEIKRLRGAWLEAEAEARRASDELQGFIPAAVGYALYEIGMIRLRRGDLPAAEDALLKAHGYGRSPEPGLSLLRLAQGKVDAAMASIRRVLEDPPKETSWGAPPGADISRITLLPAQVEIALIAGDVATARAAAGELRDLVERFPGGASRANAEACWGAVLLAQGDVAEAIKSLKAGIRLWSELDAPYEGARVRLLMAQAYATDGAGDQAALELHAARAVFERLGALGDLRRADEALGKLEHSGEVPIFRAATERAAKAFVFTDIVDSTKLAELLGDEAWNNLIRWHDQTLRSLVAEYGGEEIKATGDGFFLAFDDPAHAIECAIAIQRRLAEQRQTQGFAPAVRIGVHWAEANRQGLDYIGSGVNQAARVGGHAGGGEIMVSAPTLERSRRAYAESGRQTVELKGIAHRIEVVSIDWR